MGAALLLLYGVLAVNALKLRDAALERSAAPAPVYVTGTAGAYIQAKPGEAEHLDSGGKGAAWFGSVVGRGIAHGVMVPVYTFQLVTLNFGGFLVTSGAVNIAGGGAGAWTGASIYEGEPLTDARALEAVGVPVETSIAITMALAGLPV